MKNSHIRKDVESSADGSRSREQDLLPLHFVGDNATKPQSASNEPPTHLSGTSATDGIFDNPASATPPAAVERKDLSSEADADDERVNNDKIAVPPQITAAEEPKKSKHHDRAESNISPAVGEEFAFGKYLQEKRVDLKLSTSQVEGAIKIKKSYVEALESEDLTVLPPPVFILAYVRKLCDYYGISPKDSIAILDNIKWRLKDVTCDELPPRFHMEREGGEDNERKLRRMIWGFAAAIVCFVLLVTVAVLMIATPAATEKGKEDVAVGEVHFDTGRLNQLLIPQTIEMTELPTGPNS